MNTLIVLIDGLVTGFYIGVYMKTPAQERDHRVWVPVTLSLGCVVFSILSL
jgi:hypothetical protein